MALQWSKFETMRSILIVIAAVALSIIIVVMPRRSLLKPRVVHPYSFTRDVGSFFWRSRSASRSEIKVKIPGAELVPFVSPHQLVATPANLDFGTVDRWNGQLPALEVRLCNKGDKPWQGTIRSTLPWLAISPTTLICPAGGEVTLTGRLTLAGKRLRPRLYKAEDALLIEGNGQTLLQIGAQVNIRREVVWCAEFASQL